MPFNTSCPHDVLHESDAKIYFVRTRRYCQQRDKLRSNAIHSSVARWSQPGHAAERRSYPVRISVWFLASIYVGLWMIYVVHSLVASTPWPRQWRPGRHLSVSTGVVPSSTVDEMISVVARDGCTITCLRCFASWSEPQSCVGKARDASLALRNWIGWLPGSIRTQIREIFQIPMRIGLFHVEFIGPKQAQFLFESTFSGFFFPSWLSYKFPS